MLSKKVELYKAHLISDTMSKIKPTVTKLSGTGKPDSRSMTAITREAIPRRKIGKAQVSQQEAIRRIKKLLSDLPTLQSTRSLSGEMHARSAA